MSNYYNCSCCGAFKPECVCWGTLTSEGIQTCTPGTHRLELAYKEGTMAESETVQPPTNPKVRVPKWRLDYLNGIADQLGALGATQAASVIREAADDLARAAGEFACVLTLVDLMDAIRIWQWADDIKKLGWPANESYPGVTSAPE